MRWIIAAVLVAGIAGAVTCPVCEWYGVKSCVYAGMSSTTQVYCEPGYYDEEGKWIRNPDPNTTKTEYECTRGHDFRKCSGEKREGGRIVNWSRWEIQVPPTKEEITAFVEEYEGCYYKPSIDTSMPIDEFTAPFFLNKWVPVSEMTAEYYLRCYSGEVRGDAFIEPIRPTPAEMEKGE